MQTYRDVIGPFDVHGKHMPNEGYAVVGSDHSLRWVGSCIAICADERYARVLSDLLNKYGSEYGIEFKEAVRGV